MDGIVIGRSTIDLHQCLSRFVGTAMSICETRSFWEEKNADTKDQCEGPAHAEHDSPAGRVTSLMLVCAIVEASSEKDSESDEQLIGRNQSASDPRRCGLSCGGISIRRILAGVIQLTLVHRHE